MRRVYFSIIVGIIFFNSCSSDTEKIVSDEPIISLNGAYIEENQWIYEQMNHYYFWREDMCDSLSCDYMVDPVTFFKALLSAKDRFSYCTRNSYYTGPTEKQITVLLIKNIKPEKVKAYFRYCM